MTDLAVLSASIADQIKKRQPFPVTTGIILGSGLGDFADGLTEKTVIPTSELDGYPVTSVIGHSGKVIFGKSNGVPVLAFQGRIHFYEGHDIRLTALPVWLMKHLGIRKVILTNAAGGLNKQFKVGDLMLISDHLNFMFRNPLIGKNPDDFGPRFPDMSDAYSKDLRALAASVALDLKIGVQTGVYLGLTGPSYETPAEIEMFRLLGADAVGMSTVPEVIQAAHLGIQVLGISCITNMAAGITGQKLSHDEVTETGKLVQKKFTDLIKGILQKC